MKTTTFRHFSAVAEVYATCAIALFALLLMRPLTCNATERQLPKDVNAYIEEREECNSIGGEDYSDPNRARMMAESLRECGMADINGVPPSTATVVTVDMVEKRLRKRYRNQPTVLQAMDAAHDQIK